MAPSCAIVILEAVILSEAKEPSPKARLLRFAQDDNRDAFAPGFEIPGFGA
jgi:hypothetical protein